MTRIGFLDLRIWKPTCKSSSAVAVELAASTGVVSVLIAQSDDFARFFMRFQEYNLIFILYIAAFGTQSIKDSQYFEHWKPASQPAVMASITGMVARMITDYSIQSAPLCGETERRP